jgi:hypothetical protein
VGGGNGVSEALAAFAGIANAGAFPPPQALRSNGKMTGNQKYLDVFMGQLSRTSKERNVYKKLRWISGNGFRFLRRYKRSDFPILAQKD